MQYSFLNTISNLVYVVTPEIVNINVLFSIGNNNMLSQKFVCKALWRERAIKQWVL